MRLQALAAELAAKRWPVSKSGIIVKTNRAVEHEESAMEEVGLNRQPTLKKDVKKKKGAVGD